MLLPLVVEFFQYVVQCESADERADRTADYTHHERNEHILHAIHLPPRLQSLSD